MSTRRATAESVERALDIHVSQRRIPRWIRHPDGGWLADVYGGDPVRLKTVPQAVLFLAGLASAAQSPRERDNAY